MLMKWLGTSVWDEVHVEDLHGRIVVWLLQMLNSYGCDSAAASQLQNHLRLHCCTLKPREWDKKGLAPLPSSSACPGVLWRVSLFSFPVLLRPVTALDVGETPDTIRCWCQECKTCLFWLLFEIIFKGCTTFSSVFSAGLSLGKEFMSRWGKPVSSI